MTKRFNIVPLKNRRRKLRYDSTEAESILWNVIRNKKIGFRFVRQYSIDGYVMDFYCPREKFGIELDGGIHLREDNIIYDKYREKYINAFCIKILRFRNEEILENLEKVLSEISLSFLKRGIKG